MSPPNMGRLDDLRRDTNRTAQQLAGMVARIRASADAIGAAAAESARGNADLSARTAQQAAALEHTVSSMQELTRAVTNNAEHTAKVKELSLAATRTAGKGGEVVATMQGISTASNA